MNGIKDLGSAFFGVFLISVVLTYLNEHEFFLLWELRTIEFLGENAVD